MKEIDVSKEEISDRDNESTLMTSKVLDSSFPKANQEDGAERKDDSTLINSRFFNSSFHKANQEDGTAGKDESTLITSRFFNSSFHKDEQKVGAESKDESTLITSRFFNSSLNKTNQEDGAERKDESTLITSRFFDSSFHKANKEDVVERKDDSTLITSRFFNSSFHKSEQKVGADSKNESTLITSRFFDSSLNKSNQEDGAGRKDESTLITSKLFDLSFPGAKDPMNSTFSADNVNNLLETKLDYENKIVVLKENVEELQKKLSTSDDALSATKSQLSEQLANHEQLLSKFNDTKSSYDRMVDNFKEKIEVLNQQLAEANRQILEKATDLDATFSLEDRVELLQTKVTYEEEIIQMKEDIEALHQNLQESNDKIMQKQTEYQRARQVFDGLKAEYDARQQALQTELDKMKTMYQDLLQSKAMAEAQVQSFAEMLEEANSKLKQKADESFTLEDRKELIQTKLDYENMILKLNDDIDSCKKLLDDEKEKRQQIEELNTRLHKMNIQLEEAVANHPEVHSAEMQTSMIEQSFTAEDRAELIQAKLNDEKKIEELVAQLAEATKSCTLYMQQCQSTANGLEDTQQQLAAVKAELASTQDNLKAAKDAHEVAVADWKAKLETEMAEHSAIVDQLNVAMNQLKEDYETTLVKEHNQLKVKFDQLSAQLTNLEGQKDAWEKMKATLDEQLDKYHSMVEANRTEIDDLTNGKQRAETELAEARQAIEVAKANNETKLKSLQDEITIFVDTLAETKEELGQAKQEIEAISADKSQLQHAIDNLSLESQQTKEQCSQLLADNSNLSLRVESLCKAGAQKDDTIQQLNDEIAQLKLKLENAEMSKSKVAMEMSVKHQEAIATLTNKNEALEKNVQKMADQRVALLKEKDEVETNFWNVTTSKESMKVKYEKTVADLEDNLAKTKVELAKMAEESERSASQAEEKISDLSRHNAGLVEQMKTAKMAEAAKAEKHQQKLAELAHNKEQLEAECDQLNSQLGLMKTEKDALAEKIDKLSGEKTRFESLLADCLASHSVITPEVIGGEQQLQALDFYFKSQHDQLHKKEAELQEARANIANLTSEVSKMEALKADCKIMKASLGKRKDLIEQYQARLEEVARRNKLHKATINVGMKGFQKVGAESKQLITELQNIIGKLEKNPDEQASVKAAVVRNLFNTIIKR